MVTYHFRTAGMTTTDRILTSNVKIDIMILLIKVSNVGVNTHELSGYLHIIDLSKVGGDLNDSYFMVNIS